MSLGVGSGMQIIRTENPKVSTNVSIEGLFLAINM
jgi:hypothetical protein